MTRVYNKVLVSIFGAAIGVRFWAYVTGAFRSPLWYDESFSWLVSRLPIPRLIAATAGDVHPPLYYLLLKWFAPEPQIGARLLSLYISVIGVFVFWWILRELELSPRARLATLALMALAPIQILYSNEARMYSLLELLVLYQIWGMLTRRWWVYGLATLAALYTHNYAILYTAMIALAGLFRELQIPRPVYESGKSWELSDTGIPPLIISTAAPVLAFVPWVIYALIPQMRFVGSGMHWVQPLSFGQAANALYSISLGLFVPQQIAVLAYMLFSGGLLLASASALRAKRYFVLAWALGPFLLAVTGSILVTPMLLFRGLIALTPGLYILFVDAIDRAGRPWKYIAAALAFGILAGALLEQLGMIELGREKQTLFDARNNPGPGLVVHLEDTTLVTYSAQQAPNTRHVLLDAGCPEQIAALGPKVRAAMGLETIKLQDLPAEFTFVAAFGGFANKCEENTFHQLADHAQLIKWDGSQYVFWGVYHVTK